MMSSTRVVLANLYHPERRNRQTILDTSPALTLLGEAYTIPTALTLCTALAPDILIIDDCLTQHWTGALASAARFAHRKTRTVLLRNQEPGVFPFTPGVDGVLPKNASPELLTEAVARIMAGGNWYLEPRYRRDIIPPTVITPREYDVLLLDSGGWSNPEIGKACGISPSMVKIYLTNLQRKLGATYTGELAWRAWHYNIYPVGEMPPGN